ncbi:MAG TPA: hypothetical protein VK728_09935 [Candidatus Sulfotelmatobacter sp.]|jgi:hypothetical protein|nr:hypothetical protein [Candidatus Sulfotelmatobacter sp.]
MSLGIAIKGPEGVVLAADSRVTMFTQFQPIPNQPPMLIPSTFDHATKLLRMRNKKQNHVAAITFGAGAIGMQAPRTARSYMPELEGELGDAERMTVAAFALVLSDFFGKRWAESGMPFNLGQQNDMFFYVAGYDEGDPYGKVFTFSIPTAPSPTLAIPDGQFGAAWGGQREITDRLIQGFDPQVPALAEDILAIPPAQRNPGVLYEQLRTRVGAPIPWQFLPLQDCVDLAMFLVRTTIAYQRFTVGIRGVGGATDVATITRDGVNDVQTKQISGEREHPTGRSRTV